MATKSTKPKADKRRPVYVDSLVLQVVYAVPNEDGELTKFTVRLPQVDQSGAVTAPLKLTKASLLAALDQLQDARQRLATQPLPKTEE